MLICVLSLSQPLNPPIKQPIKQAPDAEVLVVTTTGAPENLATSASKPMARPMLVLLTLLPMLPMVLQRARLIGGAERGRERLLCLGAQLGSCTYEIA